MFKFIVFKLMMLLAAIGLTACGSETTPISTQTTTTPIISIAATIMKPPSTNTPTQTALPSRTAIPVPYTPEPTITQLSTLMLTVTPVTPVANSTPVAIDEIAFSTVSNTAVNLTFSYPDEWLVENGNLGNKIAYHIASNDALLDGLDVGESGSVIRITVEDTKNWISNAKDQRRAIEGLVNLFKSIAAENIDIIRVPTSIRINGLEAATTSFHINDDISKFMTLTFILNGEQSVTVVSVASADIEVLYAPILEAITTSIYVPQEFVTYQIATRPIPFLFRYPTSWSWRPVDDNRIIVGIYDVISTGELGNEALHIIDWLDFGYMMPPQDLLETMPDPFTVVERREVLKEIESLTINGREASQIVYNGRLLDNDVILVYTVIVAEPYMIISSGITAVANQDVLIPVQAAITDSIVLQEGIIDFADPGRVVEAVFIAARTENFGILSYLCDPRGEADEDVNDICSITPEHERRDEFVQFFATAEISGEIVIDGHSAYVPFVFGLNKNQTEIMELIQRNQLWYLLGF